MELYTLNEVSKYYERWNIRTWILRCGRFFRNYPFLPFYIIGNIV